MKIIKQSDFIGAPSFSFKYEKDGSIYNIIHDTGVYGEYLTIGSYWCDPRIGTMAIEKQRHFDMIHIQNDLERNLGGHHLTKIMIWKSDPYYRVVFGGKGFMMDFDDSLNVTYVNSNGVHANVGRSAINTLAMVCLWIIQNTRRYFEGSEN